MAMKKVSPYTLNGFYLLILYATAYSCVRSGWEGVTSRTTLEKDTPKVVPFSTIFMICGNLTMAA